MGFSFNYFFLTLLGDSGGPLMGMIEIRYELVGVTSWGFGCAEAAKPGVWAEVAAVRDWIDSVV